MNTQSDNDKSTSAPAGTPAAETEAKPRERTARDGIGRALLRLILLTLIVGAIAVAAWAGWRWLQNERAHRDALLDAQAADIARLEAELARVIETRVAQDEFETLRNELRERMDTIAGNMDALRDAAQGGRRDLIRAEIEYLLRVAADELYLTQDVTTAIYALQAADDRLRQLAEPRLNPVRALIADHLRALGAVSVPDVSGMALKLGSLMRQVSELPLRQARHARAVDESAAQSDPDATWWERVRGGFERMFDKLVVVQRAEPPPPLLAPQEHFFLYRNVELQFAAARAALLSGDVAAYRQSLETAREWLNRYFDANDPAVANAIADITGLLDVALRPEVPDINAALDRFRALSGARTE